MKRVFLFMAVIAWMLTMSSCEKEVHFDQDLLIGKWQSGTLYYRYFSNGDGYTWDTSDDVSEEEAQEFTWTLEKDELTHLHILEIGGVVPRFYTVTELTATTLKYKDDFGKTYHFTKV